MRQVRENQPSFPLHQCEHRHGKELEQVSRILDENPTLSEVVVQDLESDSGRGAPGMSGEQILRCAVIKKLEGLSYDRLAFALEDSLTLRDFCRFSFQKAPKRSTLAENISRIGPGVWKQIADALTQWAARSGLEKGRKVRIDATPVSCSIRHPTDNQLLYDAVRVLTRLLEALSAKADFAWTDHSIPSLLMVIVFVSVIGPSLGSVIVVIGLLGWSRTCRLVRGQILAIREEEFITAARSVGNSNARIIFRHILPNIFAPLTVLATLGVANAILLEAALSFLGLGVRPPTPTWGGMLNEAQSPAVLAGMPWLWTPPGIAIAVTVLAVNFIGDGLRDALDLRSVIS